MSTPHSLRMYTKTEMAHMAINGAMAVHFTTESSAKVQQDRQDDHEGTAELSRMGTVSLCEELRPAIFNGLRPDK